MQSSNFKNDEYEMNYCECGECFMTFRDSALFPFKATIS